MIPRHLVVQYWLGVRELLEKQHRLDDVSADTAINDYLALAEKHGFEDAIYHRNVEEVAEIVAYGMKKWFREPAKTKMSMTEVH